MSAVRRVLPLVVALSIAVVGVASGPGPASAGTPPQAAEVIPAADPVPGQYIVTLENGTSSAAVPGKAEQLANRYGGGLLHLYDKALLGFAVRMSPANAKLLAADPSVEMVEQDGYVQASTTETSPPSGLDRIDQRNLPLDNSYTYTDTASTVHAYVIDTGILATHTDFGGRASVGDDEVNDGQNGVDCNGHGTHVAGTLGGTTNGVAKQVRIVAVRVLGCNGMGTFAGVIAGVNWVTANAIHPAVANMSLGGGHSPSLDMAIDTSIASGVTYTLAAGNENADSCTSSPSDDQAAIVVAATTTNTDARAPFSDFGSCVDLFAPGTGIVSDFIGSNTATATLSGTSMASPHVAGAAALYLSGHPSASPADVVAALACNATIGHVTNPVGSPNLLLYTSVLVPQAPNRPCAPVPDPPVSGIGTVHLSWQVDAPAGSVQQFKLYRGNTSGTESPTPIATVSGSSSSYDDLTGAAGTWFYRITAVDARGESAPSAEITGTATTAALSATPQPRAVRLAWTIPPDVGPAISGFDLYMGNSPGGESLLASLSPGQTSFVVQLPGPNTLHYFVVKAIKPGPVATPSNELSATPLPGTAPDAPVLAASAGNNQTSLSWTVPAANNGTVVIGSYKVFRGTSPGGEAVTPVATLPGTQTSFVDGPLANGVTYFYKVAAATTEFGEGSKSNEQGVAPFALDVAFLTPTNAIELRRLNGTTPGPTLALGGAGTSPPVVVSNSNGTFVFVRGGDNRLYWQRVLNGSPQGWNVFDGAITSDPIALADGVNISVFARGGDNGVYRQLIVGLVPQGWTALGGGATSNVAAAASGTTAFVFVRGGDNAMYAQRIVNGTPQGWIALGGLITSDPAAAFDGSGVTVVARGGDNALYRRHVSTAGALASWLSIGGNITSNPATVWDGGAVNVAARGPGNSVLWQRLTSLTASPGFTSLGGATTADPALVTDGSQVWTVVRGGDNAIYWQRIQPAASGWQPLGGQSGSEPGVAALP